MTGGVLQRIADLRAQATPSRRLILDLMIEDPERVLEESFESLAERSASSVPTVMRTCRDLGFSGLRDFKLALAQELAVAGSPLHRHVQLNDTTEQVVSKISRSAALVVAGVQGQLEPASLDAAADAIARATRVDCYAVGATSGFVAADLQARLFRMGRVSNAYADYHLQLVSAATLGPGGVCMAISHVGGMPSLLEAVDVARAQGAKVVAITQPGTPLARRCDVLLGVRVPDDPVMHVGTDAYLAHFTVIEILTVLVAQRLGDSAITRLHEVREVLGRHGLDTPHHPALRWGDADGTNGDTP
jgi:DNA-binding MurR/RpiR family transcriptional regulator